MAPVALKRLIATQTARSKEIEQLRKRLKEKSADAINRFILQARIDSLNKTWQEVRTTHTDIVMRDDAESEPYVVNDEFGQLQALYEDALDESLTMLERIPRDTSSSAPSIDVTENETRVAKLPKLDLPKFSGNYEDWQSFSDLFTSLVHNAERVSDATKLQYLKSCLTGRAANLVKDVATTNANYATSWEALRARFDNPRLIVNEHLTALSGLAKLKQESATALRTFADESQRIVRALRNLQMPVGKWDVWLVHLLADKLDAKSRRAWEIEVESIFPRAIDDDHPRDVVTRLFPTFAEFADFVEKRARMLSVLKVTPAVDKTNTATTKTRTAVKAYHAQYNSTQSQACDLCKGQHFIYKCPEFAKRSVAERRREVSRLRLCYNCLNSSHIAVACKSKGRCLECKAKHHSLLHADESQTATRASKIEVTDKRVDQKLDSKINAFSTRAVIPRRTVLFATAKVQLVGPFENVSVVRVLLDQASEVSFITQAAVQLVHLPTEPTQTQIAGVSEKVTETARSCVRLKLRSLVDAAFEIETVALVLPRLTSHLPKRDIKEINLQQCAGIDLADPQFCTSNRIDVILGADVYGRLLRPGLKAISDTDLVAQNSALGWIISGPLERDDSRRAEQTAAPVRVLHCITNEQLHESLQQFWILEEFSTAKCALAPDEEFCETQFERTHTRDQHGRYVVRLPVKGEIPNVSQETRKIALKSLASVHRRFERDAEWAEAYRDFMRTYERLGHMSPVPQSEIVRERTWYLPHHAVITSTPASWKMRVVFDAARKTRDQLSLNSFLLPGPPLQRDLTLILIEWRRHKFVFTADIIKMFRQIRVAKEDQDLQRILWSPSLNEPPVDYRLNTVTYGTACAPYLAIRTLLQIARDNQDQYPLGARCLEKDLYVDDAFIGADELDKAIEIRRQLVAILRSAGVELDKWAASHPDILPADIRERKAKSGKQLIAGEAVKTLGIWWDPARDTFYFSSVNVKEMLSASTKREILSYIARLFDPLGWLSPVIITGKIIVQDLWILKNGWDESLPTLIREQWQKYCFSLQDLAELSISRWLGTTANGDCQLHGFADASTRAYGAVVYLRYSDDKGNYYTALLASKTKVAPVKTVSVPNLELCGAVLLVKLIRQLQQAEFLSTVPVFTWSDSQIVLMWLRKHPRAWKVFVANRVSFIQTELPSSRWSHVGTSENPADLASRGADPKTLRTCDLWWHGPQWLTKSERSWPVSQEPVQTLHATMPLVETRLLRRFSSLGKLLRVIAYCRRPLLAYRRRKEGMQMPPFLTSTELNEARTVVIKLAQAEAFKSEIELLTKGKPLPKRHALLKLAPQVDPDTGILYARGRLTHSSLPRRERYPPILPRQSALSKLFIDQAHRACLHGGPNLTICTVMRSVYVIGVNRLVKSFVRHCVTCQRHRPRLAQQLMGDLPAERVTPGRPFSTSGLDYAGPIQVRAAKGRGRTAYKGYIALFVCFATRAIHLEVVSDLTADSFLAAFRRFVGRRGRCSRLFSDNATTFHGADKELKEMFRAASKFYADAAMTLAGDGTNWTFIPPTTPHYGGLWEAGIKSTKHHLKRVIGEHTFTYEELSTLLVEIEACLNSRPLGPLSNDINDLEVLTPAHFLIGEASMLIPEADPPSGPENRLSRFQLLQRLRNHFWHRWSNEYLHSLQERQKWRTASENFTVGTLVLIKDDRYPPAKWSRGRVLEIHPGADGLVRVVTVKTATNTLRRHIAKLAPLLLNTAEEDEKKAEPNQDNCD